MVSVSQVVKKWKSFKGKVDFQDVPDFGEDGAAVAAVAFSQIPTIQGKAVMKAVVSGGICEACGKKHAKTIIHTVDWSSKPSGKWKARGWDDFKIVCWACSKQIVASRPKA